MFSYDDNIIWDEYEWESHIDEMTRRYEHLRNLIESDREKRPRWLRHLQDFPTKLDAVDAFIEEELLIEESHFPLDDNNEFENDDDALFEYIDDDDEEDWDSDEEASEFLDDLREENEPIDEDDEDDVESLFEDIFEDEASDESIYDYATLENIAIYTDARDFAADLMIFNDSKPQYMKHPGFIRLISDILMISSKLAAAYSMGFDVEVLGANIAYCKKALVKANQTLNYIQVLNANPLTATDYHELHRRLFELRNNIAINIQDTRVLFNNIK